MSVKSLSISQAVFLCNNVGGYCYVNYNLGLSIITFKKFFLKSQSLLTFVRFCWGVEKIHLSRTQNSKNVSYFSASISFPVGSCSHGTT